MQASVPYSTDLGHLRVVRAALLQELELGLGQLQGGPPVVVNCRDVRTSPQREKKHS